MTSFVFVLKVFIVWAFFEGLVVMVRGILDP